MNPIRLLTAREIDCRIAQIKKSGLQLLLYKDARCDMAILDETFGPMNWQRHHSRDNANCIVSIWDDGKREWIDKEDTGTESNTEAEKGLASDSFKRACVNVGIGRELYTAPFIWITPPNCEIKENNGRFQCYDRFEVQDIGYNDKREINRLVIVNSKTGNVAFECGTGNAQKRTSKPVNAQPKQIPAKPVKPAEKPAQSATMADKDQIEYIKKNASDEHYMEIMTIYGAELELLTYADAEKVMDEIDERKVNPIVLCERCQKPITGVALPDGTMMSGAEIVGKSKLTYKGVYCFACMKELNKKRKEKKDSGH